jgi:hypothetical protein
MILFSGLISLICIIGAIVLLLIRIDTLEERIAALEKRVSGSGPVVPRSPGLPQSGGPGAGQRYGGAAR